MTRRLGHLFMGIVAAVVIARPALAERIPVRSAEHDGFTRIVLDLPRPLGWSLQADDGIQRLTLDDVEAEFDLTDSFRRISSDRVSGLAASVDGKSLDISLNCDCTLETFLHDGRMLVIDVGKQPAGEGAPSDAQARAMPSDTQGAHSAMEPSASRVANRFAFPFEPSGAPDAPRTGLGPLALLPGGPEHPRPAKTPHKHDSPGTETATDDANGTEKPAHGQGTAAALTSDDQLAETRRLSLAEKRLAEQLGRAATQGLVTPRQTGTLPYPLPDHGATPADPTPDKPDLPERIADRLPGVNLRAVTSADSAFLDLMEGIPRNGDGAACIPEEDLAIADWGREDQFAADVGRLRSALAMEFDRPDPEVARSLARLYIHFGFGAEAVHVLEQSTVDDETASVLKAMADIMEYGQAAQPAVFADQFDCDNAAALWALLSYPYPPASATPNTRAIARSINALPPRLRQLLGPMASERLIVAGEEEEAAEILAMVERGMDTADPGYEMASAKLHLAEGEPVPAHGALEKVVQSNTDLSPGALIDLIDSRLAHGDEIDSELAGLAGAYAREYRRDPLGSELQRVHILSLSAVGAFDEAFQTMETFIENTDPGTALRLRSHAMEALAKDAGDVPFLKFATATAAQGRTDIDAAAGNAVAQRLIDMGFPEVASSYLVATVEPPFARQRALLRADVALETDRPNLAEAELLGLSGADVDLRRARARSISGDHRAASRLFEELDKTEDATAQAFLASDWDRLSKSDDQFWQDIASLVAPPDSAGSGGATVASGPLARDRALLDTSAATRRTVDSLLARLALDPQSEQE